MTTKDVIISKTNICQTRFKAKVECTMVYFFKLDPSAIFLSTTAFPLHYITFKYVACKTLSLL